MKSVFHLLVGAVVLPLQRLNQANLQQAVRNAQRACSHRDCPWMHCHPGLHLIEARHKGATTSAA
jgi:hypothetical protein